MAHFAELDSNNKVLRTIVVADAECLDVNGIESEDMGVKFCQQLFGENTVWKQTSYNANFRKKYAGIGFTYDLELDAFIPPSPYPSWVLDKTSCDWKPPIPCPEDGSLYFWDDPTNTWVLHTPNDQH